MQPSDVMQSRLMKVLFDSLPNIDMKDYMKPKGSSVQFDAQYTQLAYQCMLEKEIKLGNYLNHKSCKFSHLSDARETMVLMIEEIHKIKGYREETLYIAVGIADRLLNCYT